MAYRIWLVLCIVFLAFGVDAQNRIKGIVVNKTTKEPVEAANVFVANTLLGAITEMDGSFVIEKLPVGKIDVIVSFIGFENKIKSYTIGERQTIELRIELVPTTLDLEEVVVSANAKDSKRRKRYLKQFVEIFMGATPNAEQCTIVNPEAILFEKMDNGGFKASAASFIKIENRALGYELSFLLKKFEKIGEDVLYQGKPFFKELLGNEEEMEEWKKNRLKTYLGSKRHFFKSLFDNKLTEEGFLIELMQLNQDGNFQSIQKPTRDEIVRIRNGAEQQLNLRTYLQVSYVKEKDFTASSGSGAGNGFSPQTGTQLITQAMNKKKGPQTNYQKSWILPQSTSLSFNKLGILSQPQSLIEYGYWTKEGIADLLPFEFTPEKRQKHLATYDSKPPTARDFEFDNLTLPIDYIIDGGEKREGVFALNRPVFSKAKSADFLTDEDLVLGLFHKGIAKAYPIHILEYHELVNDTFEEENVLISHCPFDGISKAFVDSKNEKRNFEISAYLYHNNLIFYDKESRSLWSQAEGKAISGKEAGKSLETLPLQKMTWGQWKEKYPETFVLSRSTGHAINYDQKAYPLYNRSNNLLFPVSYSNFHFPLKEWVVGVTNKDQFKAISLNQIKETGNYSTNLGNQQISLIFDPQTATVTGKDEKGNVLKTETLYWFAWYAFHPETEY